MKNKFNEIASVYEKLILNEGVPMVGPPTPLKIVGQQLGSKAGGVLGKGLGMGAEAIKAFATKNPALAGAAAGALGTAALMKAKKEDEEDTEGEEIELDRDIAQKIFDALSLALNDETSEDAEGFVDKTKDVLKKGTYAGGGALAGNYVGKALGGPVGGIAGGVIGAGLGARAAR
jgi:hypothetical protein